MSVWITRKNVMKAGWKATDIVDILGKKQETGCQPIPKKDKRVYQILSFTVYNFLIQVILILLGESVKLNHVRFRF